MVKMNNVRGPAHGGRGRQKPRPLFPPGELPLFGPPPAYMRRPPGPPPPPIPPVRGPMVPPYGGDYGPPPPPPLRPPHLGPPIPPLPHHPMNMRRRPGPPPPPMPLLQAPIMPPRHLPFMRGRAMPRLGPGKKLKKPKNKRNKSKPNPPKAEGQYFCEVCDRSWETQEELDEHNSGHVKCHFEGCVYVAAPKLVTLHIKLQHESGVFERIVQSYDEEEIKKWKEERKRNYPTAVNIQRKLAHKKEMEERGELQEGNNPFAKKKGYSIKKENLPQKGKLKEKRRRRKHKAGKRPLFLTTASVTEDMITEETKPVENTEDKFIDDEFFPDQVQNSEPLPISGVLMAIGANYASDSEDEGRNKINEIRVEISDSEPPPEYKISREFDENPNIHVELSQKITEKQKKIIERSTQQKDQELNKTSEFVKSDWRTSLRKRPLTLLEKLLQKEIKQERSQILQCVRYIVKENFFEKD